MQELVEDLCTNQRKPSVFASLYHIIYKALQVTRNIFLRNIFLQSKQKKMQFLCAVSKKVCNFAAAKEVFMCSLERTYGGRDALGVGAG